MKKYLKLIPLIIYPYAYLIWLVAYFMSFKVFEDDFNDRIFEVFFIIFVVYNVYVAFITIYNVIMTSRDTYTAYEVAKMNMVVKGWQIPAYIFHFIMGLIGLVMSVWGIGFLMVAIMVDCITIVLTGINAIGCAIRMKREGVIHTGVAILMGIGSFVFCIDIVVSIIYIILGKRHEKKFFTKESVE